MCPSYPSKASGREDSSQNHFSCHWILYQLVSSYCKTLHLFWATPWCGRPAVGGRTGFLTYSVYLRLHAWASNATQFGDILKEGLEDRPRDVEQEPGGSMLSDSWVLLVGGSQTRPDHPVLQSPSHLSPNLGLNYHAGQRSRLFCHTRIPWFATLPTASALSFNSEKSFQQGHKGQWDDWKLWGRRSSHFLT